MAKLIEMNLIGQLLGWTALLATLAVTPWASYDPINVPKLAVIAVGGLMVFGALVVNRQLMFSAKYRFVHFFSLAFVFDLSLIFSLSGSNPAQEFFGTFGRATGLVAYVSLCGLFLAAAVTSSKSNLTRFFQILIFTGLLSITYGLIQAAGADPINWVNQYSPVIGFMGNPNFQSSFVAFTAVLAFAALISATYKITVRSGFFVYILISLYVVKETDSQQGFLVFAGGSMMVLLMWIPKSRFKILTIPAIISGIIGLIAATLGSLNSGPLANLLYKDSVTYRGDYWRAGWKMAIDNPLFGIGLDSYGEWYRRARTVEATLRRGPEITSNAAHNVLIDFASNGGFPLLIIYLFMLTLVIISMVKLLKRAPGFDPVLSGLIAVWVAYQAQSIISLNQLGLAVWGWIISGLIIGYEINTREETFSERDNFRKGRNASIKLNGVLGAKTVVGAFVGFLVGLLVGLPPLLASSKFKSALESQNAQVVEQAAYIWPVDPIRMGQVASILQENKLEVQGLRIITAAVEKFPNEYGLWAVLAGMPGATPDQKNQAHKEMKRLDPLNPNLK